GEVYQAKDAKLGRDVAIKVLPVDFAIDAGRVERFKREARLLASLNHPNIASIYGLEESGSSNFLVMELIEGSTLADRIKAGPIPVEETLKLAMQIADGLEAAHEKGIIHRDLKPANIKITTDGKIKILDFGLAKAFALDQGEAKPSDSPTISAAATMQGVILGTAAYMSPEQAKGKAVDRRADIWAFGVVLFEMLVGKPAFSGDEVSDILALVIKGDSNMTLLPENIHTRVRELLTRCLQKDLRKRYADIADARYEIIKVLEDPAGVFLHNIVKHKPQNILHTISPWITTVLISIIVGVVVWSMRTPQSPEVIKFSYYLPENQNFLSFNDRAIAISPDGKQFVYQTAEGLYLRSMNNIDAKLIHDTQGAQNPFFSPDGRWIGYESRDSNELKKIPVDGGGAVYIANIDSTGFLSWGTDDVIVYALGKGRKIMQVSARGGEPEVLIETENDCYCPHFLPNGNTVMYTTGPPFNIVVQSPGSRKAKEVIAGVTSHYLPEGHIVYVEGNNLCIVAFDPEKLEIIGSRALLIEDVLRPEGAPHYAVSDSGTLVYLPSSNLPQVRLEWYDRYGNAIGAVGEPGLYNQVAISPNGEKVIIEKRVLDKGRDLWMLDLNRSGSGMPISNGPIDETDAVWSPDGNYILYSADFEGFAALYLKSMVVEEEDILLLTLKDKNLYAEDWSRDGQYIAYLEVSEEGDKIYKLPLLDEPVPEFIVGGLHNYDEPKFSPDGKTIAYVSSESGRNEIWIKPLEGSGRPSKISSNGGGQPQWREDGKELFFLSLDSTIMTVDMGKNSLTPGLPTPLFRTNIPADPVLDQYAVTRDGQKFITLNWGVEGNLSINVVVNWFEEFKQQQKKK
ncbi:MAG: serine/threonine-protein kinase, partial [Deltaproteobacteria bacterium]|nr:serine/threonine-protein kinase [Deltaproteobacteria bacterium]